MDRKYPSEFNIANDFCQYSMGFDSNPLEDWRDPITETPTFPDEVFPLENGRCRIQGVIHWLY